MKCNSVLVVEDNVDIRETVEVALRAEGYQVFGVSNGRDGLAALKRVPGPCLVLLDLMMPGMNGWEFLERQESEDGLSRFHVVIASVLSARSIWADSKLSTSVVGYIRKPFDLKDLLQIVREYCIPVSHINSSHHNATGEIRS